MIDIAQRIRCLWTPAAPAVRVHRAEMVGQLTAELHRIGWPEQSESERRRDACRLLFTRWLVMTGRIGEDMP